MSTVIESPVNVPESEEVYAYQRENGTIEQAKSVEEIIKLCPFIGKIAQDSPEKATFLVNTYMAGQKKIEEEKRNLEEANELKKQPKESVIDLLFDRSKSSSNSKNEKTTSTKLNSNISEINSASTSIQSNVRTDSSIPSVEHIKSSEILLREQLEKSESTTKNQTSRLKEKIHPEINSTSKKSRENPLIISFKKSLPIKKVIVPQNQITPQKQIKVEQNYTFEAPKVDTKAKEDVFRSSNLDYLSIPNVGESYIIQEEITKEDNVNKIDNTENIFTTFEDSINKEEIPIPYTLESESIKNLTLEPEEISEVTYSSETMDTYFKIMTTITLSEITTNEENELNIFESEVSENNFKKHLTLLSSNNTFSESIQNENILLDPPKSLIEIENIASDQPIEQTIIQFSDLIKLKELENDDLEFLQEVKDFIEKIKPKVLIESTKLELTPELTDTLIKLFKSLGYQEPTEALINYIEKYGLNFLLQGIQYLYQIINKNSQFEFITRYKSSNMHSSSSNLVSLYIGNTLLNIKNNLIFQLEII
ncbi:MAG TPA: hypothetical protein VLF63_02545 [Patescibacteria group bacterium]|nr:hypothetical protein [Patescibacteria group bacterium]